MTSVKLNIPSGYTVKTDVCTVSVEQAREIMLKEERNTIGTAERIGENVRFTSHYVECPYCNHKIYTYAHELNREFGANLFVDEKVSCDDVLDLTSRQLPLLEESPQSLLLRRNITVLAPLTCPGCENTICHSDKTRSVEIGHTSHKVFIRAEINDMGELLSIPWLSKGTVSITFPLFEVAFFNFANGHTYIRLENLSGESLSVRDVTFSSDMWTSGIVYNTVLRNKSVKETVRRMFCDEWHSEIPFAAEELGVDELRLLTTYIGYDKDFYSAIPFEYGSLRIENSFGAGARGLRRAENIVSMYEASQLPKMKSVRKLFFANAGFFFYLAEAEKLWHILGDPNRFVTLFKMSNVYEMLSDLHIHPVIFCFIEDYCRSGELNRLFKMIQKKWPRVYRYAKNYGTLSEALRKTERKKWQTVGDGICINDTFFSTPMCKPNEKIRNCIIDDFEFSWLKTSNDYKRAGNELVNCLCDWENGFSPVVIVRKNGKTVAAIEVKGDTIMQARSKRNRGLDRVAGLKNAYEKWCKKYALVTALLDGYDDDDDYFFEDLQLPF